jgi:sigma-B regulation protein RsbU (phosphoserine phosphatase)
MLRPVPEERKIAMAEILDMEIREELQTRRGKLETALRRKPQNATLTNLLEQVDAALDRLDHGSYGLCEACGDPIEPERLRVDPLITFCLDHLSASQRRALEDDLELAASIQRGLLPLQNMKAAGWEAAYHYAPAGHVSGDYCDLLTTGDDLYFLVGDVSGKGISAALLMSHLHATFRTLVSQNLPLQTIMERASRMFCESSLPAHFATLACGKAGDNGDLCFSSAGHIPALLAKESGIEQLESTGLPLGLFCEESFDVCTHHLDPGDILLMCTDGVTETVNPIGEEYGLEKLTEHFAECRETEPPEILSSCIDRLSSFRGGGAVNDDITMMVVRRI